MAKKKTLSSLGIQIKTRLIEMNLTQRELAKYLGIKDSYLNMIMYGERSGKKYLKAIEAFIKKEPDTK